MHRSEQLEMAAKMRLFGEIEIELGLQKGSLNQRFRNTGS
jgi:hypothetical protein